MKMVVHPQYAHLTDFVRSLPTSFESGGEVVYRGRNLLKQFCVQGTYLNVKRFRKPLFINRIAYTFLRKPKAYRAYRNAVEVIKRGFCTPQPVAYLLCYKSGLLAESYFVSLHEQDAQEVRNYYFATGQTPDEQALLHTVGQYTAQLHEAGILHQDYSPGNILYRKQNGEFHLSLVDINRMKFQLVDMHTGCQNLCRLFGQSQAMQFVGEAYARQRGFSPQECISLMQKYQSKFLIYSQKRNKRREKIRQRRMKE